MKCSGLPSGKLIPTQPSIPSRTRSARMGVVLGAGAARGWAHIGALQELTALGLRPDVSRRLVDRRAGRRMLRGGQARHARGVSRAR